MNSKTSLLTPIMSPPKTGFFFTPIDDIGIVALNEEGSNELKINSL